MGRRLKFPFHFLPYKSQSFLDGSLAHLPWLQELPDVLSTAMWSSWVEIHHGNGERTWIGRRATSLRFHPVTERFRPPSSISPGIAPNVIAMPMGQGHDTFTRFASGRGANPISILAPMIGTGNRSAGVGGDTGANFESASRDSKLILFAGGMREHPDEHR